MATNMRFDPGNQLFLPVGAGITAGEPVAVGQLPGVALTDGDASNNATVKTDGVFELTVSVAVTAGDIIYLAAGVLSKTDTGVRFGYAVNTTSGAGLALVKIGY